jgi:hypothetical protein
VQVAVDGGEARRLQIGLAFAEYRIRVPAPADGVVDVELRAYPWNSPGQPAAQGVAVRRVALVPALRPEDLAPRR